MDLSRRRDPGQRGDGAGDDFAPVVQPHLEAMTHLAARLVGPTHRDDLVQEALTRAWRRWSTYDPARGSHKTWLLAIVAGEAARRRWYRRDDRYLTRSPKATDPGVRIDVERAVARLPKRQRLAIALYYFLDLDIDSCARVMECSPGTVKSTLHDARQRLHHYIEESG